MRNAAALTAMLFFPVGCSARFTMRTTSQYRHDTHALLSSRSVQIRDCYETALGDDPELSGEVTVEFHVTKKSGAIERVAIDEAKTDAPEELQQCVLQALDDLAIDPGDERAANATFIWTFRPAEA